MNVEPLTVGLSGCYGSSCIERDYSTGMRTIVTGNLAASHEKYDKKSTKYVFQHWTPLLDGYHLFQFTEKIVKVVVTISVAQNHFTLFFSNKIIQKQH